MPHPISRPAAPGRPSRAARRPSAVRPRLARALGLALGASLIACTDTRRPTDEVETAAGRAAANVASEPTPSSRPTEPTRADPTPAADAIGEPKRAAIETVAARVTALDVTADETVAPARRGTLAAFATPTAPERERRTATRAAAIDGLGHEPAPRVRPASDARAPRPADRERYASLTDRATVRTADEPVSTFSIDVDTGSYANVRRFLVGGALPPPDAVRLEELVNYFDYDYLVPDEDGDGAPFSITTELGPTPWNETTRLLHVGLKGHEPSERPAANLVFLVDVSGSMASPDKLGLLKTSLRLLARELGPEDRVGIVTYAGASGVALEPVPGDARDEIERALAALEAGGSTNGEAGIETAYRLADEHYVDGGINRVILATDGDFNVGTADVDALERLIAARRTSGIALSTLGFGTGNYNDRLMERLADVGDGNHAYIDTLNEARKVLVDELASTLHTIARDVKVQIEFNPATVAEYRLLGYVNRALANEDFADDRVDAGEVGAGHSVTALYEIALHGEGGERHTASRYAEPVTADASGREIGELRLRYKRPDDARSRRVDTVIDLADAREGLDATSDDYRFAAAVAAFAQRLRGDTRVAGFGHDAIARLARAARGADSFGYRSDFARLVDLAASLAPLENALTVRVPGTDERSGPRRESGEKDAGRG